jgi:hypothetical protein
MYVTSTFIIRPLVTCYLYLIYTLKPYILRFEIGTIKNIV